MLSEQVKNELREVRYYFSRKANMDALSINAGVSRAKSVSRKVRERNTASAGKALRFIRLSLHSE